MPPSPSSIAELRYLSVNLANGLSEGYLIDMPIGSLAENIARNLRQLREARGLSQEQLAKLSGVPRPTWANLESGSANPTVTVLAKVATALQVSVEELISAPRAIARHYPAASLPVRKRGDVQVRRLLP